MRILYFDCTGGISGDMAFGALLALTEDADSVLRALSEREAHDAHTHNHDHDHHHDHGHYSYREIRAEIEKNSLPAGAKEKALAIYGVIARAEAEVHGTTMEDVHFHEVGRPEAVRNIMGTALCMEKLGIDKVYCSPIHDGKGFIWCSHGRIPVPVPAVTAMKRECNFRFVTDEVETEMVTPSGLAVLIGLAAVGVENLPEGDLIRKTVVYGKRNIGKERGLSVSLLSQNESI